MPEMFACRELTSAAYVVALLDATEVLNLISKSFGKPDDELQDLGRVKRRSTEDAWPGTGDIVRADDRCSLNVVVPPSR